MARRWCRAHELRAGDRVIHFGPRIVASATPAPGEPGRVLIVWKGGVSATAGGTLIVDSTMAFERSETADG